MVGAIPKSSMRDFGRPINQNSNSNLKQEGNVPTSYTSTTAARQHAHSKLTGAVWLAAMLVCTAVSAVAQVKPCQGPGAPATTQTKCLTAIDELKFKRTVGLDMPFKGIVLNAAGTGVNNAASGPAGVVSHGRWLYAGDGDSSVHVINLDAPSASATKQILFTDGTLRVDEMAITSDGMRLLAANNADDPSFVTLFSANGDNDLSDVFIILKTTIDPAILPLNSGLGIEQPAWDPKTKRFYTSIPTIANNPLGCNYGQLTGTGLIPCGGGLLVPPSDCMTIYCWAARRATCRAARPRWSSMPRPIIMPI